MGPGKSIDTDKFFVICTNTLGGCFGSTGPSSSLPGGESNVRWATRFPLLSIHDMTRGQLALLDHLGIDRLYASIGSSMGGMQSLSLAYLAPERVGRVASISACGRAGLNGVGMRYAQRSGECEEASDSGGERASRAGGRFACKQGARIASRKEPANQPPHMRACTRRGAEGRKLQERCPETKANPLPCSTRRNKPPLPR